MNLRTFAIALALFCSCAAARSVFPPPTLATLQGSWLGGSGASEKYFRLEIDTSGRGILIAQFDSGERPAVYEVLSTQLTECAIQFELRPEPGAEPIYFRGSACGGVSMKLEVGDAERRWHSKVLLRREGDVLSRIEAVTRRARGHGFGPIAAVHR